MRNSSNSNVERLLEILNQEEILWNSTEKSYNELLRTSKELEKRFTIIEEERNEWKTRFENQKEINQQFRQQINQLEEKLVDVKSKNRFANKPAINENNEEDVLSSLNLKKEQLNKLLTDLNWRIEQEIKTYHKANDERKSIQIDIHEIRNQLNVIKDKAEIKNQSEIALSERNNRSNQGRILPNLTISNDSPKFY
ncbi:coiled-coil domain-containing protein [Brachionus plicatilis]|uniref:Coiled-coil domain-containing protein n=1 Tax=Brachionus plicatilis TaxID=10195 RepID=A0A3M7QER8_BRAPC|nr:coiled-coil domain-containing protein [Brachionus plicatilis]